MDRIPDMSFFFRRQEKSVLFFEMDPAVAGSLQRAIIAGGWGNRQRLVVRLVIAHVGMYEVAFRTAEETDWEETMYSQYQKRDFAISTYNY